MDRRPGIVRRALRAVRRAGPAATPCGVVRRGRGSGRARRMLAGMLAVATLLATTAPPASAQERAQPRLPTVELRAGMHRIVAELAVTPNQQAMGLMFRRDLVDPKALVSEGWDQHAEILARSVRRATQVYEVPISYHGRSYAEGKKIGWRDGVSAIWSIVKFNLTGPRAPHWQAPAVPMWEARKALEGMDTGEGDDDPAGALAPS